MIQVVYHRKYYRVTVEGHAKSGEFGRDLICAACSTLAVTLADNIASLEACGSVREMTAELSSGSAEISCTPVSQLRSIVTVIFDAICVGFDRLSKEYPDYISYEILE